MGRPAVGRRIASRVPQRQAGSRTPAPNREQASSQAQALTIERMVVRADRLVCDVMVAPHAPRVTTPQLARRIRQSFPDLPRHACVNDEGDTLEAVLDHTSLPHVLEHLVIDLQTHVDPPQNAVPTATIFVGTTTWLDQFAGRARIEVNFTDDLVALRAFRDATHFLNTIVVT